MITEDNKLSEIFRMKEPDYVMKIMVIWITLDGLEGARTRRDFIDGSGTNFWDSLQIQTSSGRPKKLDTCAN